MTEIPPAFDYKYIIVGNSICPFSIHCVDYCKVRTFQYIFLDCIGNDEALQEYKEYYDQERLPIVLANNLETGYTKKVGDYSDLLRFTECQKKK